MIASPRVENEPQSSKVRVFPDIKNKFITSLRELPKTLLSIGDINPASEGTVIQCKCLHVLIADDDPFEKWYYHTLFQKAQDMNTLLMKKVRFSFTVVHSGEELVQHYINMKKNCICIEGQEPLVITDYNMGLDKLNGVETALALRKNGFKGALVVRTSEKEADLHQKHPDLKSILDGKLIECILDKTGHLRTKEVILNYLKKRFERFDIPWTSHSKKQANSAFL